MKKAALLRLLLIFTGFIAMTMIFPLIVALLTQETAAAWAFLLCMLFAPLVSLPMFFLSKGKKVKFSASEGILLVFCAWALTCLMGALPYFFSGCLPRFEDALFESVSGFTTTSFTLIADVESLPRSLLLWRAETQWLGGMGIIVLTVALLPLLGVGGFTLLKAETTGPAKEKLTPKVTSTAKILWLLYISLTAAQFLLLRLGGMNWFDALIHAFSSIATGGFSSKNASIAAYNSPYIEWVCVFFMLVSGFNYTLLYRLLRGKGREIIRNSEAKGYFFIVLVSGCVIAFSTLSSLDAISLAAVEKSFRYGFFHTVSVITTTGFSVMDQNLFPPLAQAVIFCLMLIGGCSGSTAGGFKVIRHVILWKQTKNEMKKLLYPRGVFSIQLDQKVGRKDLVYNVAGFVFLYFALTLCGALIAAGGGMELFNAVNVSVAAIGNIGLGLGDLTSGAVIFESPAYVKHALSFLMIAGRLELWTVFVLFMRDYWEMV